VRDIHEIEKDALVCFIDFHQNAIRDNGMLPGWPDYYRRTMARVVSLAEHCQENNIAMLNREYRPGDTARELARFNWDYYVGHDVPPGYRYGVSNYADFSKVYFCGLSLDQCVMRREEGYIWTPCREKVVLRNCSLQGLKRLVPTDYVKRWNDSGFAPPWELIEMQRVYERDLKLFRDRFTLLVGTSEAAPFKRLSALVKHARTFLEVNEINWADWRPEPKSDRLKAMLKRPVWKDDRTEPLKEKVRARKGTDD
jgi:hypothetical protein